MPSHKNASAGRPDLCAPELSAPLAAARLTGDPLRVTSLPVERRLRRMAVQRVGRPDVAAAFASDDLERLRCVLAHAETASTFAIARHPARRIVPG